jgi:hypothetical protein
MFLALPIELFLVIRSYLVEFNVTLNFETLQDAVRTNSERSWRSFLSVNSTHARIRREVMVWKLNYTSVKRYLENEQFRQHLSQRMVNSVQQLLITNSHFRLKSIENNFMLELIRTSTIGCISISNIAHLTELPSSFGLQVLFLSWCQSLKQIGDYPNLKTLRVHGCERLESIGELDCLHTLELMFTVNSNSVLTLEQLLV